jgi:hypothetical protein
VAGHYLWIDGRALCHALQHLDAPEPYALGLCNREGALPPWSFMVHKTCRKLRNGEELIYLLRDYTTTCPFVHRSHRMLGLCMYLGQAKIARSYWIKEAPSETDGTTRLCGLACQGMRELMPEIAATKHGSPRTCISTFSYPIAEWNSPQNFPENDQPPIAPNRLKEPLARPSCSRVHSRPLQLCTLWTS